jgi:hypothetical protein
MSLPLRRAAIGAAAVAGLSLFASAPGAHDVSLSCSDFVVEGNGTVRAQIVFSRGEAVLLASAGHEVGAATGSGESSFDREAFRRSVSDGVEVRADGQPCERVVAPADGGAADRFGVTLAFRCEPARTRVDVDLPFMRRLPADARHLLQVRDATTSVSEVVSGPRPSTTLIVKSAQHAGTPRRGWARELLGAVTMGVEHIVTGWDHLLFLAALVLGAVSVRALVGTISAFTVAHSITLALAALGVVAPSARWVEPAIAASIVCVAAENLVRQAPGRRWPIAFAFGLVHGFGFAGALRELALDRDRLLPTLVGFNAGVEVGQLAVLAAVVPLFARLRGHAGFEEKWAWRASASIGAIGAALFVTRIWGL